MYQSKITNKHTVEVSLLTSSWQVPSSRRQFPFGTRHFGVPQWCHTLAMLLSLSLVVAHFSIFPHFVFYDDDDDVCIRHCYSSLLSPTCLCLQANMKMSSLFLSSTVSLSPLPIPFLSLADIKSTTIRLLLNLWWPRHLTAELHQRLKNTESKWGCNGSGVGPWPLIELKDMGNTVRKDQRDGGDRKRKTHRVRSTEGGVSDGT